MGFWERVDAHADHALARDARWRKRSLWIGKWLFVGMLGFLAALASLGAILAGKEAPAGNTDIRYLHATGLGAPFVIIWRDRDSMDRGFDTMEANRHRQHKQPIEPFLSCLAMTGDRVAVLQEELGWLRVRLMDPPALKGCEGVLGDMLVEVQAEAP